MKKTLSALLAFVLTSSIACTRQHHESITFETSRPIGVKLTLGIDADTQDRDKIWIDLNANGTKDEGEGVTAFYYDNMNIPAQANTSEKVFGEYVISSQKITIHGPVKTFTCRSSGISSIDLSRAPSLRTLFCHHNQIKKLDLSHNTLLDTLDCEGNWISDIDLSSLSALTFLNVTYNKLNQLVLSHNPKLTTLECRETGLTELNLSQNKALTSLTLLDNGLIRLDLSQNTALSKLVCINEKIQSLDLRHNKALSYFRCHNCLLTELDISPESALSHLFIPNNILEQGMLEKLFGQLPASPGILCIEGNPGAPTADRTTVIAKGWAELTKEQLAISEL